MLLNVFSCNIHGLRINGSIAGNPFLCFNGNCDVAPAPAVIPASEQTHLTSLIVGILLAVTVVLVGAVLGFILHKRKAQNRKRLFGVHSAHWPPVPPFTGKFQVIVV